MRSRNQRVGDQLAVAIFDVLRDRPEADRRFVYRALAGRFVPTAATDRADICLAGLGQAMTELGLAPSRRNYDSWRAAQPDPNEWPSSSMIRRAFPSWPAALEALGAAPAPDVLARRLLHLQDGFTAEECLTAIRACVEDLNATEQTAGRQLTRLTLATYKAWARRRIAAMTGARGVGEGQSASGFTGGSGPGKGASATESASRQGLDTAHSPKGQSTAHSAPAIERIPAGVKPFHNHFQSWGAAIVAAGFPELVVPSSGGTGPRGPASAYSEQAILGWLRKARAELAPETRLTRDAYTTWRAQCMTRALEQGRVVAVPGAAAISDRFPSWAEGLFAADVIDEETLAFWHKQPVLQFSREELLAAIVIAITEVGRPEFAKQADDEPNSLRGHKNAVLTRRIYDKWRRDQLRQRPTARIPSGGTICQHFDNWNPAVAAACELLLRSRGSDAPERTGETGSE